MVQFSLQIMTRDDEVIEKLKQHMPAVRSNLLLLVGSQSAFFNLSVFMEQLFRTEIRSAIALSLVAATCSSAIAIVIAMPSAYALARFDFPGKRLFDTFIDLPMVLTPIALGTLILMSWNTLFGQFLAGLGLTLPFPLGGVILAQFTVVVAISVRMLKATFEQVNPRQEQVARLLGCTAFGSFIHVTLPLARRGILAAIILTWARAIGEFGATVMVAGTARVGLVVPAGDRAKRLSSPGAV